jgi:hypothetical protein
MRRRTIRFTAIRPFPALGLILVLFLFRPLPGLGAGQGEEDYLGASLDINSRYVWRGMAWSEGPVLQPSAWTNFLGYNLMVWANCPLQQESGRKGFNEIDLFVQGTSPRRAINVIPGLNIYTYPGSAEENPWTAELALTFYIPVGPVWIYQENNLDVRAYSGAYYAELGLEVGSDFSETLGWEASLALSYASADFNRAYLGVDRSVLTAVSLHTGLEIRIAGPLSLKPHAEVIFLLQDFLRDNPNHAWRANIGLSLAIGQD